MIACPNCGGNTKFDIASQQILCEFCDTKYDPYMFDNKSSDAIETQDFEVTVFTCPQCGGEILSTDDAAAGFCSFCGASTILYSRISHEKRPGFIIPFQKTKDDCKKAYADLMKKAIFAPKELKDPKFIDGFRGIYMPYWTYYFTQQGTYHLKGKKSYRRGDYIYTDYYDLNGDIDAYYKGITFDASSSFSDTISEALAPYDVKGMKAFTPAYLSGFYADTANVHSSVYQYDAEAIAVDESMKAIRNQSAYRGYEVTAPGNAASQLNTQLKTIDAAMFPVWFMSYRNRDRVSYATVNGQTGKVVADLPVDPKRYLFGSVLLAIPIFFILNLFLTLTPSIFLSAIAAISAITAIIYGFELSSIRKKENYEDDKGMRYKDSNTPNTAPAKSGKKRGLLALGISIILSVLIIFIHPIHDYAYYACAILCLISEFITLVDAISSYNILATRRLPQFDKEGGDDRA